MIASHKRKYVFIAQPRTASRSIAEWLVDVCDGERVVGKAPWGTSGHHRLHVPDEYAEYRRFSVWRNPIDRLLSIFRNSLNACSSEESFNKRFLFECQRLAKRRREVAPWDWHGSQSLWNLISDVDFTIPYPPKVVDLWFTRSTNEAMQLPHIGAAPEGTGLPPFLLTERSISASKMLLPHDHFRLLPWHL